VIHNYRIPLNLRDDVLKADDFTLKSNLRPLIRPEGKGFKSVSLDLNPDEADLEDEIMARFQHRWSLFETVPVSFDQPDTPSTNQRVSI